MALPLSIAMVCKNSRGTIGPVLESVRGLASEIVALDSGSTDGTIELLEGAGARVQRVAWQGHVATKQQALEAALQPWVLCLDSDEPVMPDLAESIRRVVMQNDPAIAGCRVNRKVWYFGRPLDHAWQPEWRLRLVRRGAARWGGINPHDKLEVVSGGRVIDIPGTLRHDSFTDIADHLAKQVAHSRTSAQSLHAMGRRGSYGRLVISPPGAFFKQMVLRQAWRDGWRGWLAAASTAAATLMKHAILIELSRREPGA